MSLILEALRKSEAERRRGLAPDVATELPPAPPSPPRTMTTWLLPALIMATLLVLAGWWARREPAKPASTPKETVAETAQHAPASKSQLPPAMPRIEPSPAVVASKQALDMPATSTPPPAPTAATPPTAAARQTPFPPVPIPPPPSGAISSDTSMLPPVKLSMLMWDDVPSKRFVILNGQRMAEGDRYGEITVIAIERSGVVVEGNGAKARVALP